MGDAEIVFNVIRGRDERDSTSVDEGVYYKEKLNTDKLTIGVPRHFLEGGGIDETCA